MTLGKLWWTAENQQEAEKWKADLEAKGATNFELTPQRDGSTRVDVLFSVEKERAKEILGYEVEECEWLTPDDFQNSQALAEGWDLFDVEGRIQLQRIDCPSDHDCLTYDEPKFASDADALIFVALQAHGSSAYHRDAIERIGTLVD